MNEIAKQASEIAVLFNHIQTREDVLHFANYIDNLPDNLGKDPFPLFHHFADGMYTREVHIPEGAVCVGQIHRNEYFVNVLKGHLLTVSEYGQQELKAPCSFKAKAGVKHIVYTIEDSVWQDIHKVSIETVEDAEKEIFVDSYDELDNIVNGYEEAIKDIGWTKDQIELMLKTDDLVDQPESDEIEIKESDIEGKGVFATDGFEVGDIIAVMLNKGFRTPVGRYMNHSDTPNVECVINNGNIVAKALSGIDYGDELFIDYRQVYKTCIEYREAGSCQV